MSYVSLVGRKYAELTVLELQPERNSQKERMWKCRCSCGALTFASTGNLTKGKKKSCGHLRVDHINRVNGNAFKRAPFADCPHYDSTIAPGCVILTDKVCVKKGRCGFYEQWQREAENK